MRTTRIILTMALAAATLGCVTRPGTLDRSLSPGAQWTATIAPVGTSTLHGTVSFVRTDPPNQTRAIFNLAGGEPNAVHPWHVHYGVCGNDQLIVGSPANYPPLVVGSTGSLTAAAQLPVELVDGTKYVIHVHASPTDMRTVIACSALVPRGAIAIAIGEKK
jgi:hypothetical protein